MVHRKDILGLVHRLRIWRTGISWNSTPRWGSRASSWESRSKSRSKAAPIGETPMDYFRFFFAIRQVVAKNRLTSNENRRVLLDDLASFRHSRSRIPVLT